MSIYAAFDAAGQCLYVGQTDQRHPVLRWAEHVRSGKGWTMQAVRWEVLADLTEQAATERLAPRYSNVINAVGAPAGYSNDLDEVVRLLQAIQPTPPAPAWDDDQPIDLT
jgi:hypothetical protein